MSQSHAARTTRSRLSAHFTVEEFDCHNGELVPHYAEPRYAALCHDILEPLRARYGVCTVVSGFRPPAYNRSVGGALRSAHMCGMGHGLDAVAADVRFARGAPEGWGKTASGLLTLKRGGRGGLGVYAGRHGWIHLDDRADVARWTGAG